MTATLEALFIDTSLEKNPEDSHTRLLQTASAEIMKKNAVAVGFVHLASHVVRLYAMSDELNEKGQSIFDGKVGGCVVTRNEDGIKQAAMGIGFALNLDSVG